jgi:hypothetical protein
MRKASVLKECTYFHSVCIYIGEQGVVGLSASSVAAPAEKVEFQAFLSPIPIYID